MKIQIGEVGEVGRNDFEELPDKWKTIADSPQDFIDFLNDCDDSNCTGYDGSVVENHFFRILDETEEL